MFVAVPALETMHTGTTLFLQVFLTLVISGLQPSTRFRKQVCDVALVIHVVAHGHELQATIGTNGV